MAINFYVPGVPVAKGRPRAFKMHNGGIGTYTPDKTVAWEQKVRAYACEVKPATPFDIPLSVSLQFILPRPKSCPKHRIHPITKPDLDNLEKAVMDAMNGLIYVDDSRICLKTSLKGYSEDTTKIGVYVQVGAIEPIW